MPKNQHYSLNFTLKIDNMFVHITFEKNWTTVSSTYGVSRIISFNGIQRSIPTDLMSELIKRCDKSGILIPPNDLKQGDKIRVINSPFTEFITTINQIDSQKRIWILMDIMGRQTKIKLSEHQAQISC